MVMTIGALAAAAGVNVQTVRYYERRRILATPPRTGAGYRLYGRETVERLRFIKRAQELGFSLEEIQELLALRVDDPAACADVEGRTRAKIRQVEEKIRELGRLKRVLDQLAASCRGRTPTDECPVLAMLSEGSDA